MKYTFFFLLLFGLFQGTILAQNNFNNTNNSTTFGAKLGQVEVEADPQIDQLLQMHTQYNRRNSKVRGLRIQIIQNSDRQLVTKEKTKFLQLYPNINIYESYEQPFFQLRVGDFENRFEAYGVYQMLREDFNGVFIVPDMVKVSEL
ncbi:MAG: hypothetical protein ACPGVB_01005 [Chitinophagales bacterium]